MQLKKLLTVSALLSGVALLGGACTDARPSLYIDGVAAIEGGTDECEYEIGLDSDQVRRVAGIYDPQSPYPYVAPLVIGNQLVPLGDNDTLRAETSRILIQGAEISVTSLSTGRTGIAPFTLFFSGTVQPVDGPAPGLALFSVPLIPSNADLDDDVYEVSIKVFGETLGGTRVETKEFPFPIDVISGSSFGASSCQEEPPTHPCGYVQDGYPYPCAYFDYQYCACP